MRIPVSFWRQIRVMIHSSALESPISTRLSHRYRWHPTVLGEITKVLQSNEEIPLDQSFLIDINGVKAPTRSGKSLKVLNYPKDTCQTTNEISIPRGAKPTESAEKGFLINALWAFERYFIQTGTLGNIQRMEQVQIKEIPRMLNVVNRMVNVELLFDEVIINGEISDHGLWNMQRTPSQMRRFDLIYVFQQIMQGNLHVSRDFESNLLPFLDRFHEDHAAQEQWPEMCYWFSRSNSLYEKEWAFLPRTKITRHMRIYSLFVYYKQTFYSFSVNGLFTFVRCRLPL